MAIIETSGAVEKTDALSIPDVGSHILRSNNMEWEADGSSGFHYKLLFEDTKAGQKTLLMKVDAGCIAASHAHDQLEQVLVLEGDFYDEYRSYKPGDFIVRVAGALHTGGTKNGAIVLLIYSS